MVDMKNFTPDPSTIDQPHPHPTPDHIVTKKIKIHSKNTPDEAEEGVSNMPDGDQPGFHTGK